MIKLVCQVYRNVNVVSICLPTEQPTSEAYISGTHKNCRKNRQTTSNKTQMHYVSSAILRPDSFKSNKKHCFLSETNFSFHF